MTDYTQERIELAENVRVIEMLGQRWFSAVDILRNLNVNVSRRGAAHHINDIPSAHLRVITKADRPEVFQGRKGFPQMNFISESGVALLVERARDRSR
jgi:prophage antirepressor-like protein